MPPKRVAKKKGGYQMPEQFDEGIIVKDSYKASWTLGKPIGQGGFGLIYLAAKGESKIKNAEDAHFVVKIEPKENGPLFCESHFYVNCCKENDIKNFIRNKSLKHLAMPRFIASGLSTYKEKEYRFLVMDRYAKDLQSFLETSQPLHQINEIGTVCLMRQILFSLEYIHERGYAHGDIKGANLLLKTDSESFLVDFGLAFRFQRDGKHHAYEIKLERRHNGTIEYTSRDAHSGAQVTRRSDLEILGFCVIHWLCGTLPWIGLIKQPEQVQQSKIKSMNDPKEFVKVTLGLVHISETVKSFIEFFLTEINKLEFDSEPPYDKIHTKLNECLKSLGHTGPDNFRLFHPNKSSAGSSTTTKTPAKVVKKTAVAANLASSTSTDSAFAEELVGSPVVKKRQATKKLLTEKTAEEKTEECIVTTPKPKRAATARAKAELDYEEKKTVDEEDDEEEDFKKKKPKKNLHSTAVDATATEDAAEKPRAKIKALTLSDDTCQPKSPALTPRGKRAKLVRDEVNTDDSESEDKFVQKQPNAEKQTPSKPFSSGCYRNAAQSEILSKLKAKHNGSPLALSNVNVNSEQRGIILMKKRKNVPSSTVSTQTEASFLTDEYTRRLR
jgi:vaccinia related kinase